jgi:hypothetical protein
MNTIQNINGLAYYVVRAYKYNELSDSAKAWALNNYVQLEMELVDSDDVQRCIDEYEASGLDVNTFFKTTETEYDVVVRTIAKHEILRTQWFAAEELTEWFVLDISDRLSDNYFNENGQLLA